MRKTRLLLIMIIAAILLCACGKDADPSEKTVVVLTTGFSEDEIFRIEEQSCSLPELNVYLINRKNQYEKVYGSRIWDTEIEGLSPKERVKDDALAKIAQVKTMTLMARNYNISLTEEEKSKVTQIAGEYYDSLNEAEIKAMGIKEHTIRTLYEEYALADKVYHFLIKDINPEVSDDEARTITVQQIMIRTASYDEEGNREEYSASEKQLAYARAKEAYEKALAGENFDSLIQEYSDDETSTYTFGKGAMDEVFEQAAFNLGTDEISPIVETSYGYHIIKCISTFNREETDANKVKIVEEKKREVFGEEYNAFVDSLVTNINEEFLETVTFPEDP